MKSYLTYKNQIQGFEDVNRTVKTIEKIAASDIHLLKNNFIDINSYLKEVENILNRLLLFYNDTDQFFLKKRKGSKKKILIVMMGDKGLVGDLWHKIINRFLEIKEGYYLIVALGKKTKDYLNEEGIKLFKFFSDLELKRDDDLESLNNFSGYVFNLFREEDVSGIDILYSQFISLAQQNIKLLNFLPFTFETQILDDNFGFPIFENSKKEIFDKLLQKYIENYFYKIILEAKLSELSARTVAMENTVNKTNEVIKKIKLTFLKNRRRIITQRQLESFTAHKII